MFDSKAYYVRALFSRVPAEYDILLGLLTLGQDRHWRGLLVEKARPRPDGVVLDVATGTGLVAAGFAERMQEMGLVVGVDLTLSMLQTARNRMRRKRLQDHTAWVLARAENLPFKDNFFGSASISLALRNVSDIFKTIEEMTRVTRPGGMVVSLDFARPPNRIFRLFYYDYLLGFFPLAGRAVSRAWGRTLSYLGRSILRSRTGQEIAAMMARNGLGETQFVPLTMGVVCLVHGKKP